MRVIIFGFTALFSFALAGSGSAQPWQGTDLASADWSVESLQEASDLRRQALNEGGQFQSMGHGILYHPESAAP